MENKKININDIEAMVILLSINMLNNVMNLRIKKGNNPEEDDLIVMLSMAHLKTKLKEEFPDLQKADNFMKEILKKDNITLEEAKNIFDKSLN